MKKIINIFIITLILFLSKISMVYSATGDAAVYKVTMRKLEFCTGSTGVANCDDAVVVGDSDAIIDIASVDAGQSAASYGDPMVLPLGETYTHMRVTIDRKFTVQNVSGISGGSNTCNTKVLGANAFTSGSSESARKYTHKATVAKDGSPAEQNIYLVNDTYIRCNNATCGATATGQSQTYDQGTGSSLFASTHASDTGNDHVLIYKLTAPYVVTMMPPIIDIAFGTKNTIQANDVGSLCMFDASEPIVTISIK